MTTFFNEVYSSDKKDYSSQEIIRNGGTVSIKQLCVIVEIISRKSLDTFLQITRVTEKYVSNVL